MTNRKKDFFYQKNNNKDFYLFFWDKYNYFMAK